MGASQFSSNDWPQTAIGFKGSAAINGYPAGPKDSYSTLGGIISSSESQNAGVVYGPFGSLVSAAPTTGDQWALGVVSGYSVRGVLVVDESILYNEPFKSNGYGVDLPATVMYDGRFRLSSWTHNAANSLTTPYLGCVPIINQASGYIEFQPSGTTSAPSGFSIVQNSIGRNILNLVDIDPLLGVSSAGGVLLSIKAY